MSAGLVGLLNVVCRGCSRLRHPREFVHSTRQGLCWVCVEWHERALALLASGAQPPGCQVCGRTFGELDELSKRKGLAETKLVLERRDGIYMILCLECDKTYVAKRVDLYGNTDFGRAIELDKAA